MTSYMTTNPGSSVRPVSRSGGSDTTVVKLAVPSVSANRPITVTFAGMPGNTSEWIGLFRPNTTTELDWLYTGGSRSTAAAKRSGSLVFPGRSAGTYEVRAYLTDDYSRLAKKVPFTIR